MLTEPWITFIGGILCVCLGAFLTRLIQWRAQINDFRRKSQNELYYLLLELSNTYFWVASYETHNEDAPVEIQRSCYDLSMEIAKVLRKCDALEELDEILEILFGAGITTASERADRLNRVIDKYSKKLHPYFQRHIQELSKNSAPYGTQRITAPGIWRPSLLKTLKGTHDDVPPN